MNETQLTLLLGVLVSAAIMWPCFQWFIWRSRAVSLSFEYNSVKNSIGSMQYQLNQIEDERKLHHKTLEEAFDFINEDDSWGARDISRRKLRSTLMDVLRDSSVGRV